MAQNEPSVHMAQGLLGKGQPHILCPKCGSTNFRKSGKSFKCGMTRQKYQCKECFAIFMFPKFKPNPKVVDRFPCPNCGSMNVKNKGFKRKKIRQFLCRYCHKYFNIRILCFLSEKPKA